MAAPFLRSLFSISAFLVSLLFRRSVCSEYDFTVNIEAGKMHCFYQPVTDEKYVRMEIDYQVIDGGDLNINFVAILHGNILQQDQMKTDASHRIDTAVKGDYQLCFDNTFSYQQRKVVFFEIFLYDKDGNLDTPDFDALAFSKLDKTTFESYDQFMATAVSLKNRFNKIEYYQALWRGWEGRDRSIMNANLARVNLWSIVNAVVMMGVGLCQVYMIRSLFEDNSRIGKVLRTGMKT